MKRIVPSETSNRDLHQYLLAMVAPRPIALVSTVSNDFVPNLAPFSFFNIFSSNPPIAVFSANRRVTDGTKKDTLLNIEQNKELVINVVNASIVHQMSLTSVEFGHSINEFEKAGFTSIASEKVKPFRIKESPAQMECKLKEIIPLGNHPGAGHLIICDIELIHLSEEVIDEQKGRIDPNKIKLVGRMGRSYYNHAYGQSIETIYQAILKPVIGFDLLPHWLKQSALSMKEVSLLAGVSSLPTKSDIEQHKKKAKTVNQEQAEKQVKRLLELQKNKKALGFAFAYQIEKQA